MIYYLNDEIFLRVVISLSRICTVDTDIYDKITGEAFGEVKADINKIIIYKNPPENIEKAVLAAFLGLEE